MTKLEELRTRTGDLQTKIDALEIDVKEAKGEELDKKIAECRTLIDEQTKIDEQIKTLEEMELRKKNFTEKIDDEQRAKMPKGELKVLEALEDRQKLSFGQFLQCVALVGMPDGERAIDRINNMRNVGKGQATKLLRAYNEKETRAASGMSEAVPSDGGFLVGTDFSKELIKKMHDTSILAQRCRRVSISSNSNGIKIPGIDEQSRATGSRWGGVRGYWLNDADSKTASKPKFREIELRLEKLAALAYSTDELIQDASVLETIIREAMTEELAFLVDDAIYRGTGVGQPRGIIGHPATVVVAKEGAQAVDTVVSQNVINMYSRLWARSRPNAIWLANQDTLPQLMTMSIAVGTGGVPVWLPANGLSGRPNDTLMGLPILYPEYCSTLGDLGDIMLVDLSQYILADKAGIQSAASMHVRFIYDEMVYRFVYRVDGQPLWNTALTPFKGTKTQSPYITLEAR